MTTRTAPGTAPESTSADARLAANRNEAAAELNEMRSQLSTAESELRKVLGNVYDKAGAEFWKNAPEEDRKIVASLMNELGGSASKFSKLYPAGADIYTKAGYARAAVVSAKLAANAIANFHGRELPYPSLAARWTGRPAGNAKPSGEEAITPPPVPLADTTPPNEETPVVAAATTSEPVLTPPVGTMETTPELVLTPPTPLQPVITEPSPIETFPVTPETTPVTPAEAAPTQQIVEPSALPVETAPEAVQKSLAEAEAELRGIWPGVALKDNYFEGIGDDFMNLKCKPHYDRLVAFYGEISPEKCPDLYSARLKFVTDMTARVDEFLKSSDPNACREDFAREWWRLNEEFYGVLEKETTTAQANTEQWAATEPEPAAEEEGLVPEIEVIPHPETVLPFLEQDGIRINALEMFVNNTTVGGRQLTARDFLRYENIFHCLEPRIGRPMGTAQTLDPPDRFFGIDAYSAPARKVELLEGYRIWTEQITNAKSMADVDKASARFESVLRRLLSQPPVQFPAPPQTPEDETVFYSTLDLTYDPVEKTSWLSAALAEGRLSADQLGIPKTSFDGIKVEHVNWVDFFTSSKDGYYQLAQLQTMIHASSNQYSKDYQTIRGWLDVVENPESTKKQIQDASLQLNATLGRWVNTVTTKNPHKDTTVEKVLKFGLGFFLGL